LIAMLAVASVVTAQAEAQQPQSPAPAEQAPAAQAPPPAAPAPGSTGSSVQVDTSSVVGSAVRSSQGRDIGKVSQLMMDPREGRVTAVVISMGNRLGLGGETLSIPWNAVRLGQDGRNLVVTVDQQILDTVPAASPRTGNPPAR
jgi:sporulation protein YlmC with PRC-barrel domain